MHCSVALLLAAMPVAAQVRGTLDAGLSDGGMSGVAVASWLTRIRGPVTFELTGDLEGQHRLGRVDAASGLAGGRLHLQSRRTGLWLGASAGSNYLGQLRRLELGAWRTIGPLAIQVQGWQTSNRFSIAAPGDTAPTFPDTLNPSPENSARRNQVRSTTDLGVWTHWAGGRTEVRLASGMRFGTLGSNQPGSLTSSRRGRRVSSSWWSVEGTYWMMDRLGLVTSVGQSPIDPALSGSGEQFVRVGFRASLHLRQSPERVVLPMRHSTGLFRTRVLPGNEVEFQLRAPEAGRVELMADFTGWEPVLMEPGQGRWQVRLRVPPGMHRINVRYDGGAWQAPPDTRIVRDEFGQESGEVVL
jgi:hypothetical protein